MSFLLAPSALSADFGKLREQIEMLNESEADWIHVDVMDGVFVPNITFGFPLISAMKKYAKKPLDVHLMIVQPERYITQFRDAGSDILSVHFEASVHLHRSIHAIKEAGMKAGVAINPHTPVASLEDVIADVDMVLLMSVNPGFAAKKFIPQSMNKLRQLKELRQRSGSGALVEIDGGISLD
nr:ribulose-phosphate 3-epimerase [Bacteroidota bacterium]